MYYPMRSMRTDRLVLRPSHLTPHTSQREKELYLKVHTDPQSELLVSLPNRPGRLPRSNLSRYPGAESQRGRSALAHLSQAILLQTRVGAVRQEGGPPGEDQRGLQGEVQQGPGEDEGAAVQVAEPHLRPLALQSPRRPGEAEREDSLHGAFQLMWRCCWDVG